MNIINNLTAGGPDREKMIKSLTLGVPNGIRGQIWRYLSNCNNQSVKYGENYYYGLLEVKNEEVEHSIKKDIERTILQLEDKEYALNIVKEKKHKLYNILKAYSVYDPQVGYCQGMNFIVLIILINIYSQKKAFWVLVQLMEEKGWRDYFINGTPKLMSTLDKLVHGIQTKLSDLYEHLEKENVSKGLSI
jgi:hypothetical protein